FLAARAPLDVDRHDSVHTMLADRAGAACAHAGGPLALLAHRLDVFEALRVLRPGQHENAGAELIRTQVMLELARGFAGPAADTAGEIDHQRELRHDALAVSLSRSQRVRPALALEQPRAVLIDDRRTQLADRLVRLQRQHLDLGRQRVAEIGWREVL